MTSFKKTIVLACMASALSFGVAQAQTAAPDAAAPAAPMATPAPDAGADAAPMKKPMMKKHMAKKHMKKKKTM